ncbi:MAG: hypothetical protein JRG96_03030 [Deltaproteobacteria bacterium]|nr:hypothetical protein [Deltaproteobacteria bacterium]
MAAGLHGGLERLELRIERLDLTLRFTFAFHAREVRFELDRGDGYRRVFPETFSFQPERHDPTELFLQLEDLLRRPDLLAPGANPRDSQELVKRILSQAPHYLAGMSARLEEEDHLSAPARLRFHQDLAVLSHLLVRFLETRELVSGRRTRVAVYLLRKLNFRSLLVLMQGRVEPEYLARYRSGDVDPVDPSDDPSESGFFRTLEGGRPEVVNRLIVRMAQRSFFIWLEDVCLDEENQAFEKEDSPFASRELEILHAITVDEADSIERVSDLTPFLRRPGKDCMRILGKLEAWFLRCYDVRHASALIYQEAAIRRGEDVGERTLSWHTPRNHAIGLLVLVSPFLGAIFAYQRYPLFFDLLCSAEVVAVNLAATWFLAYRFCWKRDLTFFYAAVPRIGAGIIVGYLPVFLIDEVWDLASRSAPAIGSLAVFLGLVTLLYLYVEVQRRLGDTHVAFGRARAVFLLGVVQSLAMGLMISSLVGRFMVVRNWSPAEGELPVEVLRGTLEPLVGELPRIVGIGPFYSFPSVVLMVTFLSFFIGIFLQLMWEDLPITEPL